MFVFHPVLRRGRRRILQATALHFCAGSLQVRCRFFRFPLSREYPEQFVELATHPGWIGLCGVWGENA